MEALLKLGSDAPNALLDLELPRRDMTLLDRVLPISDGFKITATETMEGQPVADLGAVWGPFAALDTVERRTWLLPSPVGPDAPQSVVVRMRHEWPLSNLYESRFGGQQVLRELGRVTTAQSVMPVVPGATSSYPVDLRVGTALPDKFKIGIGAGWTSAMGDTGRWVSNEATSRSRISVGDFERLENAPTLGFPRVRILLHNKQAAGSPSMVRAVLNFYQTVLPRYPHREVAIVQAPDRYVEPTFINGVPMCTTEDELGPVRPEVWGHEGHIELQGLLYVNTDMGMSGCITQVKNQYPHAVERGLAQALAADWWRDRPWPRRDRWLPKALAAMYRDRFVEEAYKHKVVQKWRLASKELLDEVPRRFLVPLSHTQEDWAVELGARLFGQALLKRIGEPALLQALNRFHQSGAADLGSLQRELEASAHVSLDDFFAPWLVAGVRPSVDGSWQITEKMDVALTLTSDLKFGAFAIPVEVVGRRGERMHWVRITEGEVDARLPSLGSPKEVRIDPHGWLPLKTVKLRPPEGLLTR